MAVTFYLQARKIIRSTWKLKVVPEDIQILDVIIEKLGKMTKNQIVSFMHREQAYIKTAPRELIQFKYTESLQI